MARNSSTSTKVVFERVRHAENTEVSLMKQIGSERVLFKRSVDTDWLAAHGELVQETEIQLIDLPESTGWGKIGNICELKWESAEESLSAST